MSRFKMIHVSTLSCLWKVNKCVEPDLAKDWKHDPRVFHYLSLVNWKHLWVGRWSISIRWSLRKMQGLRVHRVPRRLHGVSWLRWILTWKTSGGKKHVVYHTESPKQSRAYWVANLAGISKKISKQTALEGLIPGAKKISILFASLKLKKLDSNWTSSSRLLSGESRAGPKILSERRAVLGTPSSRYFNGVSCFPALRGLQRSGCNWPSPRE